MCWLLDIVNVAHTLCSLLNGDGHADPSGESVIKSFTLYFLLNYYLYFSRDKVSSQCRITITRTCPQDDQKKERKKKGKKKERESKEVELHICICARHHHHV